MAYSRKVGKRQAQGYMGIDMNFDNVTTCDTDGIVLMHDLSKVGKIKQECRETVIPFQTE